VFIIRPSLVSSRPFCYSVFVSRTGGTDRVLMHKERTDMKRLMMMTILAAATFAFVGCKKEETAGDKLDKAINQTEKAAKDAAKAADKKASELEKKLEDTLKK
jgi:uncharacterized protein YgiB involved in biofilm formation